MLKVPYTRIFTWHDEPKNKNHHHQEHYYVKGLPQGVGRTSKYLRVDTSVFFKKIQTNLFSLTLPFPSWLHSSAYARLPETSSGNERCGRPPPVREPCCCIVPSSLPPEKPILLPPPPVPSTGPLKLHPPPTKKQHKKVLLLYSLRLCYDCQ